VTVTQFGRRFPLGPPRYASAHNDASVNARLVHAHRPSGRQNHAFGVESPTRWRTRCVTASPRTCWTRGPICARCAPANASSKANFPIPPADTASPLPRTGSVQRSVYGTARIASPPKPPRARLRSRLLIVLRQSPASADREARSPVIIVEPERGRRRGEEPYS
jgi:hypothetical protein